MDLCPTEYPSSFAIHFLVRQVAKITIFRPRLDLIRPVDYAGLLLCIEEVLNNQVPILCKEGVLCWRKAWRLHNADEPLVQITLECADFRQRIRDNASIGQSRTFDHGLVGSHTPPKIFPGHMIDVHSRKVIAHGV
jgi:hypothetical protein